MCLHDVYDINKMPKYKEAYKAFDKEYGNTLTGVFYGFCFKKRQWLKDTKNLNIEYLLGDGKTYPCGFHCYINKNYAFDTDMFSINGVVHRVLVRNIVAWGIQSKDPESLTVIAKEIFIMEEI